MIFLFHIEFKHSIHFNFFLVSTIKHMIPIMYSTIDMQRNIKNCIEWFYIWTKKFIWIKLYIKSLDNNHISFQCHATAPPDRARYVTLCTQPIWSISFSLYLTGILYNRVLLTSKNLVGYFSAQRSLYI